MFGLQLYFTYILYQIILIFILCSLFILFQVFHRILTSRQGSFSVCTQEATRERNILRNHKCFSRYYRMGGQGCYSVLLLATTMHLIVYVIWFLLRTTCTLYTFWIRCSFMIMSTFITPPGYITYTTTRAHMIISYTNEEKVTLFK